MSQATQELSLQVDQDIDINATVEKTYAALLEYLGPRFGEDHGNNMSMKLEQKPGGRWFRDLGNDTGHLWGHVQVIKPPTLIEIAGPLFMSYPALSHLQFRITKTETGSRLSLRHQAIGAIQEDHRKGVSMGWNGLIQGVKTHAERQ